MLNRVTLRVRRLRIALLLTFVVSVAQVAASLPALPGAGTALAADNGLAERPYMGWSSYSMQVYSGNGQWITAEQIMAQSDAMHEKLQPYGYEYINIDAAWNGGMDEYGRPIPSTTLYPNGLDEVIDHVHGNGQKIGLYAIPGLSKEAYALDLPIYGAEGCSMRDIAAQPLRTGDYWDIGYKIDFSNPCAQKYINSVADVFGEWGIDFLKFDSVTPGSGHNNTSIDARDDVKAWSQALRRHGIWLELSWALDHNYADYWKEYANGWRIDWDIECYCEGVALTKWENIERLFPLAAKWWREAGPGGWNDFDSLNIGNGAMDGLTPVERQTAMTFWSISSAQLYTGNDMTNLDEYGLELLTNEEAIAVNQAGRPGHPVSLDTEQQVWYANNGDGTYSVALFNLGDAPATVRADWGDLGIEGAASVRDLWSRTELGTFEDGYVAADLPAHGSRLLKVTVSDGGAATANDDDTGMRYAGDWVRNGGNELSAASQNVSVVVSDGEAANSAIEPNTATFDKNSGHATDVATTIDFRGNTLTGITYGGATLIEGTDYTLEGGTLTIKKEYLAARSVGTVNLTLTFSAGKPQTFSIQVTDSTTQNSSANPGAIRFDKHPEAQADATTTLTLRGNALERIEIGGAALTPDVDYTVSGGTVTFKKAYLATLPTGTHDVAFAFSAGAPQTIDLIVKDSSQGGTYAINDDHPSIAYHGPWNYSYNRNLGDYNNDVHFLEADGEYFEYTFEGTGVEMITELDPSQGVIDFYVDGEYKQTVNAVNAGRLSQQSVFHIAGLPNGSHTLSAVKRSGWFMLLDRLRVTLPDLIAPNAASFDKAAAQQADLQVRLTRPGFAGVADTVTSLVYGTDYTAAYDVVTIRKEYLAAQPVGTSKLTFSFEGGATQDLRIEIADSEAPNSVIAPTAATFDKNEAVRADVRTTLTANGNTLAGIRNGGGALTAGVDYVVEGDAIRVMKEYLATLPVGEANLTLTFSAGAPQTLTVTVADTTPPNSAIRPASASFDKRADRQADVETTIEPNGNTLVGIRHGDAMLTQGEAYRVSGNLVTIVRDYLAAQPTGMINLELVFDAGRPQTLSIAVHDTALGRYVSLNDDASGIVYTGSWQSSRSRGLGDYQDDVHYTEKDGDSFEFTFEGTGVEIVTEKEGAQGDIDIYIDGEFRQTVSTWSQNRQLQQTVFAISGLPEGAHTLKAVKKNGYYMLLDRLRVRVSDLVEPDQVAFDKRAAEPADVTIETTVDESGLLSVSNGETILSPGTDYTVSDDAVTIKKEYLASLPEGASYLTFAFRGDYGNDVHATRTNGDAVEYRFSGSGFDWIGPKGPDAGEFDLYVDGAHQATVNAHHDSRQAGQTLFSLSGLPDGEHVVKAVKRSGERMLVDRIVFRIGAAELTLGGTELPGGTVGEPYQAKIPATGGVGSHAFALTDKDVPKGLALGADGVVSGSPTKPGMNKFTVTLTDEAGATISQRFSIQINNPRSGK
ncbi:X2-like carbohydrate binding domain-containing protein [Paenibacillus sp.]|uniref:X2-like carbohydrate binding domain-containing protein n=1 Tax=Paenibacillus sp. TaxID=58172 RepID=UPI00281123BB|nr:X2-like carbohydrate binding domain-containing protein [Paenibacillus sp.]